VRTCVVGLSRQLSPMIGSAGWRAFSVFFGCTGITGLWEGLRCGLWEVLGCGGLGGNADPGFYLLLQSIKFSQISGAGGCRGGGGAARRHA